MVLTRDDADLNEDVGEVFTKYNITLLQALAEQMKLKDPPHKAPPQIWDDGAPMREDGKFRDATKEEVMYYLDPKNHMDGDSKFQFLDLSASGGISEEAMKSYLMDKGILAGKEKIYLDAAEQHNISEVYLAAHSALETGNGTSILAKGILYNGKRVYNMYGIGAFDSGPNTGGKKMAYEMEWFTPEKAIEGGAEWISKKYIHNFQNKQNTLYKMRWSPDKPGHHQYATDVRWAMTQTKKIKFSNFQNAKWKFDIPVYASM
ncbi:N-acetylglucosaminidase [Paenibacillus sp. NPDC055715]